MTTVRDVFNKLNDLADVKLAEKWDNVGLMVGDFDQEIKKIMVCLDVTTDVVKEASLNEVDLIVSHHPLIFKPLKSLDFSNFKSNIIREVIKNDISVISMHTNLDSAKFGLNDYLAKKLELNDIRVLFEHSLDKETGLGRIGKLKERKSFADFSNYVKDKFDITLSNLVVANDKEIETVALLGGSGGDFIYSLPEVDVYLTGDVTYHVALDAQEMGLNIIDIGHFTEHLVKDLLVEYLENNNYTVVKSKSEASPFKLG